MPSIFTTTPGTYVKIDTSGGGSGTALISVENLFTDDTLLVTKFSFAQKARVQYRPTLGGDIYVYPLGNEMGAVQISGIVPFQECGSGGEGGGSNVGAGFTKLASFFESKKASNVQNIKSPIQITLPGLSNFTSKCYLESLSVSGVDPVNKIFGFDLMFRVAPSGGI